MILDLEFIQILKYSVFYSLVTVHNYYSFLCGITSEKETITSLADSNEISHKYLQAVRIQIESS